MKINNEENVINKDGTNVIIKKDLINCLLVLLPSSLLLFFKEYKILKKKDTINKINKLTFTITSKLVLNLFKTKYPWPNKIWIEKKLTIIDKTNKLDK